MRFLLLWLYLNFREHLAEWWISCDYVVSHYQKPHFCLIHLHFLSSRKWNYNWLLCPNIGLIYLPWIQFLFFSRLNVTFEMGFHSLTFLYMCVSCWYLFFVHFFIVSRLFNTCIFSSCVWITSNLMANSQQWFNHQKTTHCIQYLSFSLF